MDLSQVSRFRIALFTLSALLASPVHAGEVTDRGVITTSEINKVMSCDNARSLIFRIYESAHAKSDSIAANLAPTPDLENASPDIRERYLTALTDIHQIMTSELTPLRSLSRVDLERAESDPLLHLGRLEMRSQIEPAYVALNLKLDRALQVAEIAAHDMGLTCAADMTATDSRASFTEHQGDNHYGALFTMATAYQSCQVLEMPLVTSQIGNVEGVIRSIKIDGVGWGRAYTDLGLLKRTHYYHNGQTYAGSCMNQDSQPLVYDYGGIPFVSSNSQELNLFINRGGGPALGIDCSAFVSTSVATVGSLYRMSTENRPVYTRFVSRDFINPIVSGWTCYDSVTVSQNSSIATGDIAAVFGHVLMIDHIGSDPFGLSKIASIDKCASLTSRDFDFSVIQSSSSKEHLGINRYVAKDYLNGTGKMPNLFLGYAKQACLSKFDHKVRNPVTSVYGMIRHKNSEECVAPRVTLVHEDCVSRCSKL